MLDLRERTLLQRRYVFADASAHHACFSFGSMAALPEGRVAVGSWEAPEGSASVSIFDMGMADGELACTGAQGRAEQAPRRTVLHMQPRHEDECAPFYTCCCHDTRLARLHGCAQNGALMACFTLHGKPDKACYLPISVAGGS